MIDSNFGTLVFKDFSKTPFFYLIFKCFDHFWAKFRLGFSIEDATNVLPEEIMNRPFHLKIAWGQAIVEASGGLISA